MTDLAFVVVILFAAFLVSLAIAGLVSRLLAFGMSQRLGEFAVCTCRKGAVDPFCPRHGREAA